jgi:NTE family protein
VPSREQGFVTHDVHRQPGSVPQSDRKLPELPLGAEREVQA